MKIVSACIYALNIPFVESFGHNLHERKNSDSIIVKLTMDSGVSGYGEGVPRPYVTGETQKSSIEHIKNKLLPRIIGADLSDITIHTALSYINERLSVYNDHDKIKWNASSCAVELAFIDCLFRSNNASVTTVLPAQVQEVTYSAVISTGSIDKVERIAQQCKSAGFNYIKLKVSQAEDIEKVALVRSIMGKTASIRLDANCAFSTKTAIRFLDAVEQYTIECIEQPLPREDIADLADLRMNSPVALMADESIVTITDARELIEEKSVDYFNLRISKCGGLFNPLAIAQLAQSAEIGLQVGCQVGETAILSAAGRHFAAHLKDVRFIEGSYGTHLLTDDISKEDITFGVGGKASILKGVGLGIKVQEHLLERFAEKIIQGT